MLIQKPYLRERAVMYANRWAFRRNPLFADFESLGGNCTNFVSQCVYAGCGIMNYTPEGGWNTHIDKDGTLNYMNMIEDYSIARWYDIPQPEPVPEAWVKEWEEQI